jgi:hypothetical protein
MEDGSLLPVALDYMEKIRDKQCDFNFPYKHFPYSFSGDTYCSPLLQGEGNALVISLFCVDSSTDVDVTNETNRKDLLRKLASLHSIIHSRIIPTYNK